LDFFRKNSAVSVVAITTALVAAGNLNSNNMDCGFLFGYFQKPVSNESKIQHRVKNHSTTANLTMVQLANANINDTEEDVNRSLLISEDSLEKNQMQFQVLTATNPPDAEKLLQEGADVAVYEVKEGDTVSTIAEKFNITTNTILWANDIDNVNKIMPGDTIFILPVTGLKHVVKDGDSIKSIAKKYKADEEKIIAFNELPANGEIKVGEELVIPDGEIEQPKPVSTPGSLLERRDYYSSDIADSGSSRTPSIIDKNPKGGHSFPYGYCTWYVASKKYVPWGGNAGTWLYHAKAYGAKTGKTPKVGSIIVTSESWYGHVGIVEKVSDGNISISEMNYAGWAKVSRRTISSSSRVIKGYIY
jgi:LysM repeat protein